LWVSFSLQQDSLAATWLALLSGLSNHMGQFHHKGLLRKCIPAAEIFLSVLISFKLSGAYDNL
jgi:hypothetical protein